MGLLESLDLLNQAHNAVIRFYADEDGNRMVRVAIEDSREEPVIVRVPVTDSPEVAVQQAITEANSRLTHPSASRRPHLEVVSGG